MMMKKKANLFVRFSSAGIQMAILIIGGADDDSTHYIYGIDNNSIAAVSSSEVALLGTVTTDITNGIQGLIVDNFIF